MLKRTGFSPYVKHAKFAWALGPEGRLVRPIDFLGRNPLRSSQKQEINERRRTGYSRRQPQHGKNRRPSAICRLVRGSEKRIEHAYQDPNRTDTATDPQIHPEAPTSDIAPNYHGRNCD